MLWLVLPQLDRLATHAVQLAFQVTNVRLLHINENPQILDVFLRTKK